MKKIIFFSSHDISFLNQGQSHSLTREESGKSFGIHEKSGLDASYANFTAIKLLAVNLNEL
jgi:hypothetical protein